MLHDWKPLHIPIPPPFPNQTLQRGPGYQHASTHLARHSHSHSSSPPTVLLRGPRLTMMLMTSNSTSAAAMVVSSALVSKMGATSTRSAATILTPSRPRRMVRSSRVVQPPVSGVPLLRE